MSRELAKMLKFDDVLEYLGEFGPYQKRLYFLVCLMAICPAMHAFAQVFLAAETDHWCNTPELEHYYENCTDYAANDICTEIIKNFSIPLEDETDACGDSLVYSNCYRYDITDIDFYPGKDITKYTNTTIKCDHGWRYDRSQYKSTVFQEFDLVCDRYPLGALSSSMYMAGLLIGGVLFGALADKVGRMKSIMIACFGVSIVGTACAFSPNIIAYSVFRLATGATAMGTFLTAFVIGTEMVGPSKRVIAGVGIEFFFSFGYMLLALLAYLIRYWWILQLAMSVPCAVFIVYYWIIPESPRWLLATGRTKRAEEVIRKYEKGNGVTVPQSVYDEIKAQGKIEEEVEKNKASFIDLLRYPNMRKKTLNVFYNWFTVSLVYYGLSLNTSNLGGSDYLNAFLSGAVEIPAYTLSLYIPQTILGRRWSMFVTEVIGGVACILTLFVPKCGMEWIGITLAMLGKLCISASFAIIYVFTAELYPTPVRTIGMGLASMCARIGGILAPQMILIGTLWEPLPIIIFGSTSIVAGVLALLLPETRNKKLPETIEESEEFGKKTKGIKEEQSSKNNSVGSAKEKYEVEKTAKNLQENGGMENKALDTSTETSANVGSQTTEL
ncbi:organic cation transporter protein-like [Ptychodera flava]|uniref:organic cation transporter protein-like n=1 Tax=Ptychodera flava TaxID=63121 RepID=UPI003969E668